MGRRISAVVGTCAVHALVVAAWFATRRPKAIEHADDVPRVVELDIVPSPSTIGASPGGSARPAGHAAVQAQAPPASPARSDQLMRARRAQPQATPLAAIRIDHGGSDGTEGANGDGHGRGAGHGDGIGAGIGLGLADLPAPTPTPKPPPAPIDATPASRARPARLIYPSRQREIDDALLFVARLVVDDDGFVVGARLVRGFGGRRDQIATDAVWRFRYDPARDAGGHPITSTVDQRFDVTR